MFSKKRKKGDLAINTVMILFVAIISILLLLALFAGKLPSFGKNLYCMSFYHLQKQSFVPDRLRADTSMCSEKKKLKASYIFEEENILTKFSNNKEVLRLSNRETSPSSIFYVTLQNVTLINASFEAVLISAVQVGSNSLGTVLFNMRVGNATPFSFIVEKDYPREVQFFVQLNQSMQYCASFPCRIPINITPQIISPSGYSVSYALQNLKITYKDCFVAEDIVGSMLACWERAKQGRLSENLLCDELVLGPQCRDSYELNDATIASIIAENNLCDYLPHGPPCSGDRVDFRLERVTKQTNILVEYDSASRMIRVS